MTINNVSEQFSTVDMCLTMFHNLILAPDGKIYFDANFETAADWSRCYFNGNVFVHQNGQFYCLGGLPRKCISLPAFTENTAVNSIDDVGFFLHSKEPVLDSNLSAFAVFRVKDVLVLYIADASISSAIYGVAVEYTSEDESLYGETFYHLVKRHNPGLAEKTDTWIMNQTEQNKEA